MPSLIWRFTFLANPLSNSEMEDILGLASRAAERQEGYRLILGEHNSGVLAQAFWSLLKDSLGFLSRNNLGFPASVPLLSYPEQRAPLRNFLGCESLFKKVFGSLPPT